MTDQNTSYIDVAERTMPAFVQAVVDKVKDGYAIDPAQPGDCGPFGNNFTVSMFRNSDTISALRRDVAGVTEKPRLSREEILANARAAKKLKATGALDVSTVQSTQES